MGSQDRRWRRGRECRGGKSKPNVLDGLRSLLQQLQDLVKLGREQIESGQNSSVGSEIVPARRERDEGEQKEGREEQSASSSFSFRELVLLASHPSCELKRDTELTAS